MRLVNGLARTVKNSWLRLAVLSLTWSDLFKFSESTYLYIDIIKMDGLYLRTCTIRLVKGLVRTVRNSWLQCAVLSLAWSDLFNVSKPMYLY